MCVGVGGVFSVAIDETTKFEACYHGPGSKLGRRNVAFPFACGSKEMKQRGKHFLDTRRYKSPNILIHGDWRLETASVGRLSCMWWSG